MLQMMFSTNGLLQNIHRNILYVTVQQETVRQVQVMTFNHLLHLKYEWHVKRKTGEVLRSNDRGANSGLVRTWWHGDGACSTVILDVANIM